jgi:hypothetical protein
MESERENQRGEIDKNGGASAWLVFLCTATLAVGVSDLVLMGRGLTGGGKHIVDGGAESGAEASNAGVGGHCRGSTSVCPQPLVT